MKHTSFF